MIIGTSLKNRAKASTIPHQGRMRCNIADTACFPAGVEIMTTLPTTTRIQLPRPAGNGALAMPGAPAAAPATGMTAGDVWRVLRANAWLITSAVVLGGIIGFFANMYLAKNYSRFTATGWVQISEKRVGSLYDPSGSV